MLKLKKELTNNEEKELCRNSYITEIAFYIGTQKFIDEVIKEKLVNLVAMDGMYAFNLYVNFVAEKFKESNVADIYSYVDRYFENDLADFITEYFEDEKAKEYYVITMLCKDDENYYVDNIGLMFDDFQKAKTQMFKCANNEYQELQEVGNFEFVNLNDEIVIYDKNKELVTKYEIIRIKKEV